jgi:hypothetical protein
LSMITRASSESISTNLSAMVVEAGVTQRPSVSGMSPRLSLEISLVLTVALTVYGPRVLPHITSGFLSRQ